MKISVHFDRYKFYLSFKMSPGNTAQSIGNRTNNAIGILTLVVWSYQKHLVSGFSELG